jgi:hypothetical protein
MEAGTTMNRFFAAFLLLMPIMPFATAQDSRTFKSVEASRDVALETDPGSAFWRIALPVYATLDSRGRSVPGHRTEIRSRWTKDNLYFLFVCPYEELNLKPAPDTVGETNQLWNWDVAEVFIGSDFKNIRRYKEFELSPQGEWVDLDINLDSPRHEDGWIWNSGWQVAARIDREEKIWYGAMRIPFKALDNLAPSPGSTFRVNLYRSQGPPAKHISIAWQPTMSDKFHVPERFGLLELTKGE